jgi:hypothetical protein
MLFLPSLLLCGVLLYMPTHGISEGAPSSAAALATTPTPTTAESANEHTNPHEGRIIKITDSGLEPPELIIESTPTQTDTTSDDTLHNRVVFFLNDTTDSLITLDVDTQGKKAHCASGNLKIQESGGVRSNTPIVPKDFASTCFHNVGSYPFSVLGIKGRTAAVTGVIQVR